MPANTKDYVLFMLFIKYISDKYGDSDDFAPPVTIPKGASFKDMVALKGDTNIGDKINTQVIQPLIDANSRLARSDFPDFNDLNKLGEGSAKVERLSNLIAIFQKPELDFSKNRAEHDDILGDAYEYLMRHFASESGKSKGQFYTPSEVSRIMAKVIGISPANSKAATTAYDPTCGSGSLLLKVPSPLMPGLPSDTVSVPSQQAPKALYVHQSPDAEPHPRETGEGALSPSPAARLVSSSQPSLVLSASA
jgi:type I restriction enzyme M protein